MKYNPIYLVAFKGEDDNWKLVGATAGDKAVFGSLNEALVATGMIANQTPDSLLPDDGFYILQGVTHYAVKENET